ncbi:MAG: hypothetical protein ACKVQT_31045 [Burkholderiales bacterium]
MSTESNATMTLLQRIRHEFKELIVISFYLYITLGAVIMVKAAVLYTQGITFAPFGIAAVKAVILAKFMLLGNAMKLGERFTARPLIWPTLHKALVFMVLLVILNTTEEAVVGLLHHQSITTSLGVLFGPRLPETIAGFVIVLLLLIPYFAFKVLDEELGAGRLARMFFVERKTTNANRRND